MGDERELTENEQGLLRRILEEASFPGARELIAQVPHRVTGGLPMSLNLIVEEDCPRSASRDGPIPVRALAEGEDQRLEGEVFIWVKDGYLSGLEFGWLTDEMPNALPAPERIRVYTDEGVIRTNLCG